MRGIRRILYYGTCVASMLTVAIMIAPPAFAKSKPYNIALSNSYIGNQWRVEMINCAKGYAKKHPDEVKLRVTSTGLSVQKQIASIDDMISNHVDAIIIDPANGSGLNPVIKKAVEAGIPVVTFDHAVTSKYAYQVGIDLKQFGKIQAEWLVKQLHGKGNIISNRGVAGMEADNAINDGQMEVFKKYPGIHIVTTVYGKWDQNVSQSKLTQALVSHPNIDGIANQFGAFGATKALINLGHAWVPMTGGGSNGFRTQMLKYKDKGLKGISASDPPAVGAYALKVAIQILNGDAPKNKHINVNIPVVTTATLKEGVNVFPKLSANLRPFNIPGANLDLTVHDAMGK